MNTDKCTFDAVNNRIAELEREVGQLRARLKELEWREITPESLPKVGDELLNAKRGVLMRLPADYAPMIPMMDDFTFAGWTHFRHFRPINPPARKP
jgi:hypothetical protein